MRLLEADFWILMSESKVDDEDHTLILFYSMATHDLNLKASYEKHNS